MINNIHDFIQSFSVPNGNSLILQAVLFAAEKHKIQRRKDPAQTAYINHPLAVLRLLEAAGINDPCILVSGVLHDTVEDTETTLEEIERWFGRDVMVMVAEVTDNKDLEKIERKKAEIEKIRNASDGAKLIKIADKISNVFDTWMHTPIKWSVLDVQGYACWSKRVVEAATVPDSAPNAWLVNVFKTMTTNSKYLAHGSNHAFAFPLLPSSEEDCLTKYYAAMENNK